ncbi:transcriptional regulator [Promicromonospora sp. AC04]|uniref:helix-turn-helix transcriptional regulator n=1 Tax=Promicromonospora sp. AC04 TaxID=2135723 RepID=UPI000D39DD34|nr:WYL domain-containing protein [Promicromonospora sp. AC04]PUB25269.1 transcriptional regulator [Promicromonospora sp. AC04]
MTRPTSRVLQLLELLQSSGTRTVGELAGRLEVDERTVRRYVGHLLDLEIPVESVRGRYGGYRIAAGYRMPPLMLSGDEALAVLFGLVAIRTAQNPGVSAAAAETAIAKIRRALPERLAGRARTLLDSAVLAPSSTHSSTHVPVPDAEVLLTVADAVHLSLPLAMRYRSGDGIPSERTIHPYELVAYAGRWYVVALDTQRREERTFRLDRIAGVRTLPGTFRPPVRDGAPARLVEGFARADYEHHVVLRIQAGKEHIEARLPPSVAILEQVPAPTDGPDAPPWFRVDIRAARLDWIPAVIAALDCPVVIDAPGELRKLVSQLAKRLTAAATATA